MVGFSSDDAFAQLLPVHPLLAECIEWAHKKYERDLAQHFPLIRLGAKRHIMHELIVQRARLSFADTPGVKIIESSKGHFLLVVRGRRGFGNIVLRFKHLDEHRRTRTYPTKGALRYDNQLELDEIPSGIRLNVGYQSSEDDTDLEGILVTRARGTRVLWYYPIARPGTGELVQFVPQRNLPFPATGRRAKPKAGKTPKRRKSRDSE